METAVVLGASGAIGKAVTDTLISRNIHTKILVRDIENYKALYVRKAVPGEVHVIQGGLDNNEALAKVCEYADTIFVCFNTQLRYWERDMIRWISRVSDVASALQARLVFPGNISNFGHSQGELINEEYPQHAHTTKGQLSIAIENRLARAAMEGATLSILRFPNIYGPAVRSYHIKQIFDAAISGVACDWFGDLDKKHDFIFSEDVGEIMVRTALEPKTADSALHIPGPKSITPREWITKIYQLTGYETELPVKEVPKWKLQLRGLFNKDAAELAEQYYLFEEELLLDGTKYRQLLGDIPYTPLTEALNITLDWFKKREIV